MNNNNETTIANTILKSDKLRAILADDPGNASLLKELQETIGKTPTERWLSMFITSNSAMLRLKDHVRKLAPINDPVLIFGETGTGKELLAHALHGERKGRFVAFNCAGMPESLVESELFGHIKGAFTGALTNKTGLMEEAENGTLFLDEIGDLAIPVQAKLLRAIQEMKIRKVGANEEFPINCRIVSATHRNLEEWTESGKFREDLYYRISTQDLKPTALRQRSNDIPKILEYLDKDECEIEDYHEFTKQIDINKLKGNVRSLQKIYRRYLILGLRPHE